MWLTVVIRYIESWFVGYLMTLLQVQRCVVSNEIGDIRSGEQVKDVEGDGHEQFRDNPALPSREQGKP